jgi:hypothetical protein
MFPDANPNDLKVGTIKKGKDNKLWLVVPNSIGNRYVYYKSEKDSERRIQIHSLTNNNKTFLIRITKNHILIYPENKDPIWLPNYINVYYSSKDPNRLLIEYRKIKRIKREEETKETQGIRGTQEEQEAQEKIQIVWIEGNILKSFLQ